MKCIICEGEMKYYFTKDFKGKFSLNNVDYFQCTKCGFSASKTHYGMSNAEWEKLNHDYHMEYLPMGYKNPDDPKWIPRLKKQAKFLSYFKDIVSEPWLDWGSGTGILSNEMVKYGTNLDKYDKYLENSSLKYDKYNLVLTTSVFEHIRDRNTFNEINSLVSDTGVMGIHTFISDIVIKDPNWFYLLPVHCTFHTVDSMKILFKEWGYKQCIYYEDVHLWMLCKEKFTFNHDLAVVKNEFFM